MSRLVSRAAVPTLAALALMTPALTRPVAAQTSTTTAPGATTTTDQAPTTVPPGATTVPVPSTTTLPGAGLPPDDIGPSGPPPASLPPVQLAPGGADGGGTAINPADGIAAPGTLAPSTTPEPGAVPRGLAAGLVGGRGAERRLSAAIAAFRVAQVQLNTAQGTVGAAQAALTQAAASLDAMSGPQQAAAQEASTTRARLRRLAAAALATDTAGEQMIAVIASKDPATARARVTTIESISHEAGRSALQWSRQSKALNAQTKAAADAKAAASQSLDDANRQLAAAQAALDSANLTVGEAQTAAGVGPQVVPGIPDRVLAAYVRAAQWMSTVSPDCHMTWWALAAIGRVESGNASRYAVAANGDIVPRIIGIPLDGTNGTALIPDSDHGVWDGDTTYDRAVGPMQFIPGTWRTNGVDATGDHIADPNNIYDAAFAAARYLCAGAGGQRVDTQAGLQAAAFSYNHSAAYVAAVWNGSAPYRLIAASS